MKWKDLKLGRKFFIAFGLVIALLVLVSYWAIHGIGGIVNNAEEVIRGNELRTEMENKYVQHLLWAQDVNELLTDKDVTELKVETNPHQCAFGKWYYGEGRQHAEEVAPELAPLFDRFEEPHSKLHESAKSIDEVFVQADRALSDKLHTVKSEHLNWMHEVKDALLQGASAGEIQVETDDHQCNLGKWLYSEEVNQMKRQHPQFGQLAEAMEEPHSNLHQSVIQIEQHLQQGDVNKGKQYYDQVTETAANRVLTSINEVINWNNANLDGMEQANQIYDNQTLNHLDKMGNLFNQVIEDSKGYIMTDQAMLDEASKTENGVIIFSIVAALAGILLATVIARGLINPINKGVRFAQEIARGNLQADIDVDQKDEIGTLAEALKNMATKLREIVANIRSGADNIAAASQQMSSSSQEMSQGSSEQASSAEEVSSSMEEMVSNIQQNTENAKETEKISSQAADSIREGNKAAQNSMQSMKEIAEKISIINDIAFQTNILALNAAVEAARAGEHGKGFAVVASEVRKLAERSGEAANEIDEKSKSGVEISEKAGQQLDEIVPEIEKTSQLVQEINAASNEMNSGADQVNNAIQQLNQVTQQNAASSEELATSAEELSSQADQLKQLIAYFNVGVEEQATAPKANRGFSYNQGGNGQDGRLEKGNGQNDKSWGQQGASAGSPQSRKESNGSNGNGQSATGGTNLNLDGHTRDDQEFENY